MPLRILLADENLAVQKLVEMALTQENMNVTITDNGLSALDIAIKQSPDLILADYKMGGLNIVSFIKKAKEKEIITDIPIILLVDSSETHDPVYLRSLGVESFLKKPIDTQELKECIKSLDLLSEPAPELMSETPVQSEISRHFTSSDEDSDMIADLLGWSTPEEKSPDRSNPEIQLEESDPDQIDPLADEENPFSDEEQSSPEKETPPTFEKTAQDTVKNDLLKAPVYGEPIIVPQHEAEIESPAFSFEENDPFATDLEESEVEVSELEATEKETTFAAPSPEALSATKQEQADETGGLDISDELIRKTVQAVQETAERIVREMLPTLVKSSLSQEMITPIVEGVAWELIPPLAESEIKKEIKRLQPEKKQP